MPTKKKFIDKKNAVTFRLVHRSQKDPLQADERAPKHVLVECTPKESKESMEKRKEEQRKYGVYFDDDYDYLQHLRDVNIAPEWEQIVDKVFIKREDLSEENKKDDTEESCATKLNLPSSVFQSSVEEKEGLLNKAAPVKGPLLDWDPDIVAALDDDFDFEDPELQIEDDFMAIANGPGSDEDITEGREGDDEMDDTEGDEDDTSCLPSNDDDDDDASLKGAQLTFSDEETKSRFTNYSLSSSVMHRNEGLKTLDERFEKTFEQYDDDEIGSLSGEDIGGCVGMESDIMKQLVEQFQKEKQPHSLKEIFQQHVENLGAEAEGESSDDSDDLFKMSLDITPKEERWDCESVLSTYSNIYNHPKLITEPKSKKLIKVSERTGLPLNVLAHRGLTKKQLKALEKESEQKDSSEEDVDDKKSMASHRSITSIVRSKNETPEERRLRKGAVKQLRRERRMEKKANKMAFKLEERRQEQVLRNLRENLQGVKLL